MLPVDLVDAISKLKLEEENIRTVIEAIEEKK